MEIYKLKECPFCGGEPTFKDERICVGHGDFRELQYITCKDCGIRTKGVEFNSSFDAEEKSYRQADFWDTRKPMERIVEHLEEKINAINSKIDRDSTWGILGVRAGYKEAIEIVRKGGIENDSDR